MILSSCYRMWTTCWS